jgi:hypothetical protein
MLADLALQWELHARDAAAAGRLLVGREDRVHVPVGNAVAAAGGLPEVARDKHYHTMGS